MRRRRFPASGASSSGGGMFGRAGAPGDTEAGKASRNGSAIPPVPVELELPFISEPSSAQRFAALELPRFPWQVIARDQPSLLSRPVAVVLRIRQREEVVAVSDAAAVAGARPGQTLSEARALVSELEPVPADPSRESRVLREVAEALLSLAPVVELAPPRSLILDASAASVVMAQRNHRSERGEESLASVSNPRPRSRGELAEHGGPPRAIESDIDADIDAGSEDIEESDRTEWLWGEAVLEQVRLLGLAGRVVIAGTPEVARILAAMGDGEPIRRIAPGAEAEAIADCDLSRLAKLIAEENAPYGRSRPARPGRAGPSTRMPHRDREELFAESGPPLLPSIRNESWALLERLGIGSLGALLLLPRATLMTRLGAEAEALLGLARGGRPRPLRPYRPREPLRERMELDGAVENAEALVFVGRHLAERLAARLQGRGVAASRIVLELEMDAPRNERRVEEPSSDSSSPHEETGNGESGDGGTEGGDGSRERLTLELARPATRAEPLVEVLRERLSRLQLRAPVKALSMEVGELATRRDQLILGERPQALEALDSVLSRLVARFGEEAVGALQLEPRWEPERAFRVAPFRPRPSGFETRGEPGDGSTRAEGGGDVASPIPELEHGDEVSTLSGRPTRLQEPEEVALELDGPEGRRVLRAILRQGHRYRVADWGGPERLSTGWWEEPAVRDYVTVLLADGTRVWVFRDSDERWWLQGVFD